VGALLRRRHLSGTLGNGDECGGGVPGFCRDALELG
jgi:hypothetical protein